MALLTAIQFKATCPFPAVAVKPVGVANGGQPGAITLSNVAVNVVVAGLLK